eukprot:787344-Amphidinium_carterae.2
MNHDRDASQTDSRRAQKQPRRPPHTCALCSKTLLAQCRLHTKLHSFLVNEHIAQHLGTGYLQWSLTTPL